MRVSYHSVHTDRCSGSSGIWEAGEPGAIYRTVEHGVTVNQASNGCLTTTSLLTPEIFIFYFFALADIPLQHIAPVLAYHWQKSKFAV